ncbi:MAG: type IV pili methyl-accepting chemotaxis transducer N-terminal domain-containing protein [Pseudomonadota bacterium]
MKHLKFSLISTLIVSFCLSLATAYAQQEMATTINLAGKQRMLTQKMSKEILLIAKGVNVVGNKTNLGKTAALFDRTLKGLLNGDKGLGLVKTENPAIVRQLKKVEKLWGKFRNDVKAVLAGNTSTAVLEKVARRNLPLLREMNKAVKMYEKASGSSLAPKMAVTINLAGKQRMLTQKMTKELLLVANGIKPKINRTNLKKTVSLFNRTLRGLLDGDAGLGLPGTTDAAIRAQLNKVNRLWNKYKPLLTKSNVSQGDLVKAAKLNMPLLKEMNKAVHMYAKSAK